MIILKYPTYEDKVAIIEESMTGRNDANIINVAANDTRAWVKNTTGGAIAQMGYAPRGDNVMSSWQAAVTNKAWGSQIPWNAITPWFVVGFGVDNASINTGVNISGITMQFYDYSVGAWRKVDTGTGNPTWGHYQNYANSTITSGANVTKRVESDGSWSITIDPAYGVAHGGSTKYSIPATIADHLNLRGIFVKMHARLVLIDESGVDDRHLAQVLVSVSADFYPETTSTVANSFAGVGYAPATSLSKWELLTGERDFYCATIGPPPTINPNISPYVVALNTTLMPLTTFEAHLPPYIRKPSFDTGYYNEHSNVSYGADSEHLLDVYGTGGSNRKTIVMVHGGFWVAGDKANTNVVRNKVTYWCSRGYAVVSINYRMTGVALSLLPLAQVTDIETALDFLKANAATYGIDTTKIILMGHSSGGHIATLFAITRPTEIAGAVILDSAVMDMDDTMNNTHIAAFDTIFGASQAVWDANSPKYQFTDYNEPDIPLTHTMIVSSTISAQMTAQNTAFATLASATLIASGVDHETTNSSLGLSSAYTTAVANFIETLV